jgi:hypothetical protein
MLIAKTAMTAVRAKASPGQIACLSMSVSSLPFINVPPHYSYIGDIATFQKKKKNALV